MPYIKCLLPLDCLLLDLECKTSDRAILICGSKRWKKQTVMLLEMSLEEILTLFFNKKLYLV